MQIIYGLWNEIFPELLHQIVSFLAPTFSNLHYISHPVWQMRNVCQAWQCAFYTRMQLDIQIIVHPYLHRTLHHFRHLRSIALTVLPPSRLTDVVLALQCIRLFPQHPTTIVIHLQGLSWMDADLAVMMTGLRRFTQTRHIKFLLHDLPFIYTVPLAMSLSEIHFKDSCRIREVFFVEKGPCRLKTLHFEACGSLRDDVLERIVRRATCLETLTVTKCGQLCHPHLVSSSLRSLKIVHCKEISNEALKYSMLHCPQVTELVLSHIPKGNPLLMSSRLQRLHFENCFALSWSTVHFVLQHCTHLVYLQLKHSPSLQAVHTTTHSLSSTSLQSLELDTCSGIDDYFLSTLHLPQLRQLSLYHLLTLRSPKLTLPQLVHLKICSCTNLRASTIVNALLTVPTLHSFTMEACGQNPQQFKKLQ